ncbi:MAG: Dyp-type peroxidase, partial [Pseudomonadota bacterium]|nr:Dyp-type peroxidase [Pseudomonadota bacterium]
LKSPATRYDLLFWFHPADYEDVLDAALSAQRVLDGAARLKLDVPGLVYRDSRDLTGFVDGSANPREDARFKAALVPAGEASAGSAFVMIQKCVDDLPKLEAVSVPDQDRIIGRTKPDSIELEGDAKPPNFHVSRTDVKLDGTALKICRRSATFGGECEKGLYFIAFSCDPMRFDVLLQRMFGRWKDELHDQLVHYSSPVSGSYWFAPSQEDLAAAGCTG